MQLDRQKRLAFVLWRSAKYSATPDTTRECHPGQRWYNSKFTSFFIHVLQHWTHDMFRPCAHTATLVPRDLRERDWEKPSTLHFTVRTLFAFSDFNEVRLGSTFIFLYLSIKSKSPFLMILLHRFLLDYEIVELFFQWVIIFLACPKSTKWRREVCSEISQFWKWRYCKLISSICESISQNR